ncbi:MAG: CvpA family protein [Candidatus Berkiellales bacterium]
MTALTFGTPDLIIIGIILLSVLIGVVRGLIKESISLVTWITAIVLAGMFAKEFSHYITFIKADFIRWLIAFLLIFIGVVFIGAIINFVVGSLIRQTPFSAPDRVLGSLFGLLRGMVLVTILVLLGGLTPLPEEKWWQESYSISQFQGLALWLRDRLPEDIAKGFRFQGEPKRELKEETVIQKPKVKNIDKDKSKDINKEKDKQINKNEDKDNDKDKQINKDKNENKDKNKNKNKDNDENKDLNSLLRKGEE